MIHDGRFKLIYYPYGNVSQLFDLDQDPREERDLSHLAEYVDVKCRLLDKLVQELYGDDLTWIRDGRLIGVPVDPDRRENPDFGLINQRGYHWPSPEGHYGDLG